jgi:hypothetical protein
MTPSPPHIEMNEKCIPLSGISIQDCGMSEIFTVVKVQHEVIVTDLCYGLRPATGIITHRNEPCIIPYLMPRGL